MVSLSNHAPAVLRQAQDERMVHLQTSLQFKRVSQRRPIYSIRVGLGCRALGLRREDRVYWFWMGSHAEYGERLRRL